MSIGPGAFARSILDLPCPGAEVDVQQLQDRPWVVRLAVACPCGFSTQVDSSYERFTTDYALDLPHRNGEAIIARMRASHAPAVGEKGEER